jgi:hypothetical protein
LQELASRYDLPVHDFSKNTCLTKKEKIFSTLCIFTNLSNPVMTHSVGGSPAHQRRKAVRWDRLSEWAVRWALTVYARR